MVHGKSRHPQRQGSVDFEQHTRENESQLTQAERMIKCSLIDLKMAEVGDNVAVPIPMVDRGRGDPRNIP